MLFNIVMAEGHSMLINRVAKWTAVLHYSICIILAQLEYIDQSISSIYTF